MTFDFLINGQESPSGAALLGLHSLMAITFLIQAHIPSHLDADSAQDIVHERIIDIDRPTAGYRRGGGQEALDVAAVTGRTTTRRTTSIASQRSPTGLERSSRGTSTKMTAKVLLQQMKGNPMPEHTD
jgi:uncharacterized protein YfaP (DUF2135 family)